MALEKTVTTPQGFEAVNAYHRVKNLALTSKNTISFHVQSLKDSNIPAEFASEFYSCQYDLNGANPMEQAYIHLKTLPEFAGAKDC
jgi:hypothetical protein